MILIEVQSKRRQIASLPDRNLQRGVGIACPHTRVRRTLFISPVPQCHETQGDRNRHQLQPLGGAIAEHGSSHRHRTNEAAAKPLD